MGIRGKDESEAKTAPLKRRTGGSPWPGTRVREITRFPGSGGAARIAALAKQPARASVLSAAGLLCCGFADLGR